MANELEGLAKNLADMVARKGNGINLEYLTKLLATENGRKILALLMADGGENIKRAANDAKNGDMSGVRNLIATIAQTKEGEELLNEISNDMK